MAQGGTALVPTPGGVHDPDDREHDRDFHQHADHGRERGPDSKPNRLIAAATASSKKLLAPIRAAGAATQCATPNWRLSR